LPMRKDGLWKSTCFELFAAEEGKSGYWEVNAAPNRDWNMYRFDGYREGMREEPDCEVHVSVPFSQSTEIEIRVQVHLPKEVSEITVLDCGITAVILDAHT